MHVEFQVASNNRIVSKFSRATNGPLIILCIVFFEFSYVCIMSIETIVFETVKNTLNPNLEISLAKSIQMYFVSVKCKNHFKILNSLLILQLHIVQNFFYIKFKQFVSTFIQLRSQFTFVSAFMMNRNVFSFFCCLKTVKIVMLGYRFSNQKWNFYRI